MIALFDPVRWEAERAARAQRVAIAEAKRTLGLTPGAHIASPGRWRVERTASGDVTVEVFA